MELRRCRRCRFGMWNYSRKKFNSGAAGRDYRSVPRLWAIETLAVVKIEFFFLHFFFWTVTSREGEPKSLYEKKWIRVNIRATALLPFPLPNINPNLLSVDCCWFRGRVSCSDNVIDPKKSSRLTRLPSALSRVVCPLETSSPFLCKLFVEIFQRNELKVS